MYHSSFDAQNEIAFNNFNGMLASYFLPNMCDYKQYREEFPFAVCLVHDYYCYLVIIIITNTIV